MSVRVRFAPSPTGYLHIGSVWTALFTWMYARRHGGQFILRIEDTDEKRSVEGAIEYMMNGLRWFGIQWDEGPDIGGPYAPYIQTERHALYQKWAHWLVEQGHAYKCFATEEELEQMRVELMAKGDYSGYDRRYRDMPASAIAQLEAEGRPYVIRLKMPLDGQTVMPDLLRGDVVFENRLITDYVLLKSSGLPTYHLAHVVDDHFMQITHVTRGIEWLSTAPIHIQLWKAFGWQMPVYVHFPVILNPNGEGKLSKRKRVYLANGEPVLVFAEEFREAGYLQPALVNFLTNIGWSFGNDIEKFKIEEAIVKFDLADISPAPTRLPYSKLDWLNGQYIQELSAVMLAEAITPFLEKEGFVVDQQALLPVMPALAIRLKRLTEAANFLRFLYQDPPLTLTIADLTDKKMDQAAVRQGLQQTRHLIATLQPLQLEPLKAAMTAIGEQVTTNQKAGIFLGKARLAITRQQVSPPLFESILALGQQRTLQRLDEIIALLH